MVSDISDNGKTAIYLRNYEMIFKLQFVILTIMQIRPNLATRGSP